MADYTILLIDYSPRSIEQIRTPLEAAGYTVKVANNGTEGKTAFLRILPDLTLIEPMLPKKHGFEVCRELKETAEGESVPFLLLVSVYQGRRHRDQARHQSKCDGFVEKPIRENVLLETIANAIGERSPRTRPAAGAAAAVVGPNAPAAVSDPAPARPSNKATPRDDRDPVAVPLSDDEIGLATELIDGLESPAVVEPPGPDNAEDEITDRLNSILGD